jgi:hypothetical protein
LTEIHRQQGEVRPRPVRLARDRARCSRQTSRMEGLPTASVGNGTEGPYRRDAPGKRCQDGTVGHRREVSGREVEGGLPRRSKAWRWAMAKAVTRRGWKRREKKRIGTCRCTHLESNTIGFSIL